MYLRVSKIMAYVCLSLLSLNSYASSTGLGYLPSSWYQLPENTDSQVLERFSAKAEDEASKLKGVSQSVQNILRSNERALNEIEDYKGKRWYLDNVRTQLAVGASGLVGLMSMKGSASVRLYWRPKTSPVKKIKSYSPTSSVSNYDLSFKTDMSREDVVNALEPTIKHAVASGRIYNRQKFRKNLLQATTDFHSVVSGAKHYQQQANWFVNGFMLELYVTASGDVAPFAAVGAELRLRFVWERVRRKESSLIKKTHDSQVTNERLTQTRNKLTVFLSNMIQDLEIASHERLENTEFYLKKFRIGLGVGVKGSILAAKVKSTVYFYVMFKRAKKMVINESFVRDDGESFMSIVSEKNNKELAYAKRHQIPYELQEMIDNHTPNKKTVNVIYKIKRKYFRKGIAKAYKMISFFAKETEKKPRKKWEVYHVEGHFELSVTGGLGLASLSGIAAARVNFYKK